MYLTGADVSLQALRYEWDQDNLPKGEYHDWDHDPVDPSTGLKLLGSHEVSWQKLTSIDAIDGKLDAGPVYVTISADAQSNRQIIVSHAVLITNSFSDGSFSVYDPMHGSGIIQRSQIVQETMWALTRK